MTGNEFNGVDLDRLADFVGGALDGTPEAVEIERLVAEDPDWRGAYAALGLATGQVQADLAALGAASEPMPPDIADRLDAALRSAAGAPPSHRRRAGTPMPAPGVPPSGPTRWGNASGGPPTGRPPRRRNAPRRWVRWSSVAAVVVAVLALGGIGANVLRGGGAGGDNAASTAGRRPEGDQNAAPAAGQALPGGAQTLPGGAQALASGTDYRPETLAGVVSLAGSGATAPRADEGTGQSNLTESRKARATDSSSLASAAPAELRRLINPADRQACLDALGAGSTLYAGYVGPATVQVVDYARFRGEPALVVYFVDGRGVRRVAAVGPRCGEQLAGADVRYAEQVG